MKLFGESNNKRYLKEVKRLIVNLSAEKFIEYHGPVQDVADVYVSTDLLCLVSLYEGFSNVISEGLASGVPIVASNIEENRFLIEDKRNGFLVNPQSPESISIGIENFLMLSKEEREEISLSNRLKSEKIFDQDKIYEKYQEIFSFI